MKKIIFKTAMLAMFAGIMACDTELDTVPGYVNGNVSGSATTSAGAYMSKTSATVVFPKETEGGETIIEPRLTDIAAADTKITLSVEDYLTAFNQNNNTEYQMLPLEGFEMYEEANPANKMRNGKLTVTVKKGNFSSKVRVKVNPLLETKYPISNRYAIPVRIASTSAARVLSDGKDALVTFSRPFKTSVLELPRGRSFVLKLSDEIKESSEFTIQAQFMFHDQWTEYEPKTINMTLMNMGYYSRVYPHAIQIKDGSSDGDDTHAKYDMKLDTWYQVTFTFKDNDFKVYLNGELIKVFRRANLRIRPGYGISILNPQNSYSTRTHIREFRLWDRVLSDAEIKDKLYLPVNPESEGLVAYLPMDKKNVFKDISKYKNEVSLNIGIGPNSGNQDHPRDRYVKDNVEIEEFTHSWTDNVKFPSKDNKLEIEP
ncbi:DUF1735 and LamG domain-containing protein [Capnocytophaga sp.]|uniref:DUF1735 and LamG domain-containing protein n=1 Tax=Capnocytophaga sp. TaxID=44737 RepID=UPI0026DD1E54|nr:DUF1735 and LamG domain-containing protein [Capnocytophaga sp.]MDO5105434.1 DUF1735 and LamG domain-containing protein [Capnocytophaga sp.]